VFSLSVFSLSVFSLQVRNHALIPALLTLMRRKAPFQKAGLRKSQLCLL
jgi:hypothetical protein